MRRVVSTMRALTLISRVRQVHGWPSPGLPKIDLFLVGTDICEMRCFCSIGCLCFLGTLRHGGRQEWNPRSLKVGSIRTPTPTPYSYSYSYSLLVLSIAVLVLGIAHRARPRNDTKASNRSSQH